MEGSFADAANNHGFKRSRWRRLKNQRIQDYLIASIQNIRILINHIGMGPKGSGATTIAYMHGFLNLYRSIFDRFFGFRKIPNFLGVYVPELANFSSIE